MNEIPSSDVEPVYASYLHEDGSVGLDFPRHWKTSYEPNQNLCLLFASPEHPQVRAMILGGPNRLDAEILTNEDELQELLCYSLQHFGIDSEN